LGKEIRADYSQTFLLPPSLEEMVAADHPARFIRDFVGSLDLGALGFRVPQCRTGRPPYAAALLLSVWLYGYLNRLHSSRGLERACREHLSLLWLTGMNSPDHNTLWRFWDANKPALRAVFRSLTLVAYDAGLIDLALHAVDGTKIRARSSMRTGYHQAELERLLARLDGKIAQIVLAIEAAEERESGEYRLPEKLVDAQRRREEIKRGLTRLSAVDRAHLHPGEEEARVMRCGEGFRFGYNAQVVVDRKSSLIVADEVVNDESDNEMLVPMIKAVEDNLGYRADETVADGGYYSPGQLAAAAEHGMGVLVPVPDKQREQGAYHKSAFTYDESQDVYLCPEGHCLRYKKTTLNSHGKYRVRWYHCRTYQNCPVRWACSRSKQGRIIQRGEHEPAVAGQRAKQRRDETREVMKLRMGIVEPIFALIKEHMGFRRWTVRGLEKVRTQWSLICTAFNLKKLYRFWRAGQLAILR
jgi:transposase